MVIQTKNLKLNFNKNKLELCNIFYNGEEIIKSVTFFDKFFKELIQMSSDSKYINPISGILNKLDWIFDTKIKKKEVVIFSLAKYKQKNIKINISISFTIKENEIIIKTSNNSNKKIFYGVSVNIKSKNNHIELPYELKKENFIQINFDDFVTFKSENYICRTFSTLLNVEKINKNNIIFTPLIRDKKRRVLKTWRVSNNNKNFNALSLRFFKK